jgi:ABC-type multidrug transport system ATPase subunit
MNMLIFPLKRLNKLIGFVPQHDVLMPSLTVRENIWHSARIRLPSSWGDRECLYLVDKLITCLGLAEIQHQTVGSPTSSTISGGQRRRVSIGIELAAAPVALFLDEPTSGLDATTSLSIMRILKTMSQVGVTIICIIHQPRPEILGILDGIHLLSDGYAVYHGDASTIGNYFQNLGFEISSTSNVADAVLDIVSGHSDAYCQSRTRFAAREFADCWNSFSWVSQVPSADFFTSARQNMRALTYSASARGAPWMRQVSLCFVRSIKQQWRSKASFLLEILVGAICGMLIGLALYELRGRLFQGIYLPPFERLSSAVNYMLVPEVGLLCCMAIGQCQSIASSRRKQALTASQRWLLRLQVSRHSEKRVRNHPLFFARIPFIQSSAHLPTGEIYWREASSGHSRSAYYIGKVFATLPRMALSAIHFTTLYCSLATPIIDFWLLFVIILLYFYCESVQYYQWSRISFDDGQR